MFSSLEAGEVKCKLTDIHEEIFNQLDFMSITMGLNKDHTVINIPNSLREPLEFMEDMQGLDRSLHDLTNEGYTLKYVENENISIKFLGNDLLIIICE